MHYKRLAIIFSFFTLLVCQNNFLQAQNDCGIQVEVSTLPNSSCLECNYEGPTILINELMISPSDGDGSLSGFGGVGEGRGEWIELYNPNWCDSVDISCYYLGNSAPGSGILAGTQAGGYVIPEGTIVPPLGFAMVRGGNADPVPPELLVENGGNVVELVVPYDITDPGVCVGPQATRLWFPNNGGWFAFYDADGVPQDAVSWGSPAAGDLNGLPCVAQLGPCNFTGTLPNYNNIPESNKELASSINGSNHTGQSIRRIPDGGAWSGVGAPTYATCNDPDFCLSETGISTCNGQASVTLTGGNGPFEYQWNDAALQESATALNLCSGDYELVITDNDGCEQTVEVTILEDVFSIIAETENPDCGVENGSISISIDPADGNYSYEWSSNTGITNTSTTTATGLGAGTYSVTVSGGGCTNDTTIVLTAPDGITDAEIVTENTNCDQNDGSIEVVSVTGGTAPYNYELEEENTTNQTGLFNDLFAGTYSITITDENDCTYSITDIVLTNTPGITDASLDRIATICGEDNGGITVTNVDGGTAPYEYSLNGSSNTSGVFTNLPSDYYTVEVTDANGCTFTFEEVLVNPSKSINSVWVATTPASCDEDDAIITIQGVGGGTAPYEFELVGIAPPGDQMVFEDLAVGPYVYIVTDDLGCTYEGIAEVFLQDFSNQIVIPNVFTPNNDQVNDLWFVEEIECVKEFSCVIVNRWGNKIYEYFDVNGAWDGRTLGGNKVTTGVYFYKMNITFTDDTESEFHGHITVPDMR